MHYSLSSQTFNWQQKSPTGFIRVKLIELDPAPIYNSLHGSKSLAAIQNVASTIQLDPYCAISIKEKIGSKPIPKAIFKTDSNMAELCTIEANIEETVDPNGNKVKLSQQKPTFYPKWNTCFDCHLYPGRYISIQILNSRSNELLGRATVAADTLAAKARDRLTHHDWVCYHISSLCDELSS